MGRALEEGCVMAKVGRPSDYSKGLADLICERLADGESLRTICSDEDMPNRSQVFRWLGEHPEFADQYARAREAQAEALVDEAKEIVDDGRNDWMERLGKEGQPVGWVINGEAVQRSRLRAEHRRWAAEKLKPKVFGVRQTIEHAGGIALSNATEEELSDRILELVTTGRFKLPQGVQLAEGEEDEEDDFSDIA